MLLAQKSPAMRFLAALGQSEAATLVKSTLLAWNNDRIPRLGASLAFYTVLSLAPMLVVVLGIAGLVFGHRAAQGQLVWQIQDLVGYEAAHVIQSIIQDARQPASGVIAAIAGIITLMLGASAVVNELRDALNTIWHVQSPSRSGWRVITTEIRNRLLSFAIVLAVGFFLVVSLAANAWVSAAGAYFSALLPAPEWLLQFINSTASFLVVAFLFAVLYKTLPAVPLEWGDVAVGSLATSALFTLGKFLISMYLGRSTIASAYGAAGSLVIFLLWVYYSAQVFFLGAEFTYVYTCRYGSKFRHKLEKTPAQENVSLETPQPGPVEKPELVVVESVKSGRGSVAR